MPVFDFPPLLANYTMAPSVSWPQLCVGLAAMGDSVEYVSIITAIVEKCKQQPTATNAWAGCQVSPRLAGQCRGVPGRWDRAEALRLRLARLHELLDQLVGECLLQDDTLLASQGFGQRLSPVILNEDNES